MKRKKQSGKTELVPFEKSRRVIYLEKRGRELEIHPIRQIGTGCLTLLGVLCILYCLAVAVVGFGTYFFLVWGVLGILCLALAGMLRMERLMEAIPKWLKGVCAIGITLGLVLFCVVEGFILSEFNAQPSSGADYCIILGAQWKDNGPSEVLRRRLDEAIIYLNNNPETKVIVSGGQGGNERITEAAGMQEYLINAGIATERIFLEDKSTNTYENLVFSGEFLDETKDKVVIVTNNFHVFRALGIAKKQGYTNAEGLAASSVTGLIPNNLLREFLGVIKDFVVGNL